jgi:hypothetical protein
MLNLRHLRTPRTLGKEEGVEVIELGASQRYWTRIECSACRNNTTVKLETTGLARLARAGSHKAPRDSKDSLALIPAGRVAGDPEGTQ